MLLQVPQLPAGVDSTLKAQIFSRLDTFGQKLGVAASHIWEVLVRQAYATAAENFGWMVCAIILSVVSYRLFVKADKTLAHDREYGGAQYMLLLPVIGFAVIACACLTAGLKEIINPEYWAWNQLVQWVTAKH